MNVKKMTDAEVLKEAGVFGPAIIGQELYDRAQAIRKVNPDGRFGPAMLDAPADSPTEEELEEADQDEAEEAAAAAPKKKVAKKKAK